MAGRGPAPKGHNSRKRDEPVLRDVVNDGTTYGMPLPNPDGILPSGEEWHIQTLRFWDALRHSPLMKDEDDLSWSFLIDTALMHHTMWTKGRWDFAAELRLRLSKFGVTPDDRMRLKIKVVDKPGSRGGNQVRTGDGSVTDITSRRSRLLSE